MEVVNESVPRLVEALAVKKVVGAATGHEHTVVWTQSSLPLVLDTMGGWATERQSRSRVSACRGWS